MILDKLLALLAILIALICHEYAHGYVAYLLGDDTAKKAGRLSFNPLKHLDWLGVLSMLIFRIGWARAVPINSSYFKNPRRDSILVALAGCFVNFILGAISIFIFLKVPLFDIGYEFLKYFISFNIMLGIFNLIPLPPLDGSKVLISLLPWDKQRWIYQHERWFYIGLVLFVFSGMAGRIILPIMDGYINFWVRVFLS